MTGKKAGLNGVGIPLQGGGGGSQRDLERPQMGEVGVSHRTPDKLVNGEVGLSDTDLEDGKYEELQTIHCFFIIQK